MSENVLVEFIVEYDDGRTARMAIDCYTFGVGNHFAGSRLGTIKSVRRSLEFERELTVAAPRKCWHHGDT